MRVYLLLHQSSQCRKVLQSVRDTNQELSAQLQCLWEDPSDRNLDISSYLLAPMSNSVSSAHPTSSAVFRPTRTNVRPIFCTATGVVSSHRACGLGVNRACAGVCGANIGRGNEMLRDRESQARFGEVSNELRIGKDLSPFTNSKSIRHATTRSNAAHIHVRRAYPRCMDILVLRASNVSEARVWTEAVAQSVAKAREGIVVVVSDSRWVRTCHCWCGGWDTFQLVCSDWIILGF
ncbi:hypothetical protein F5J12DRAFT_858798 [Pisolithus orientalis]|uniref:uncharacterized protein n=1 Tax=Pisolithus orientalis TaxID=936130 RepID=UPI0022244C60|nr:uncharacterized protein F5J12DRAFT_858798 [Pisolithus orientalis]KAI5993135.1 hypothetical protein F5J12DRAFT_858798 [Pisolithus orientalis]